MAGAGTTENELEALAGATGIVVPRFVELHSVPGAPGYGFAHYDSSKKASAAAKFGKAALTGKYAHSYLLWVPGDNGPPTPGDGPPEPSQCWKPPKYASVTLFVGQLPESESPPSSCLPCGVFSRVDRAIGVSRKGFESLVRNAVRGARIVDFKLVQSGLCGFVTFADRKHAEAAQAHLHERVYHGRILKCEFATPKSPRSSLVVAAATSAAASASAAQRALDLQSSLRQPSTPAVYSRPPRPPPPPAPKPAELILFSPASLRTPSQPVMSVGPPAALSNPHRPSSSLSTPAKHAPSPPPALSPGKVPPHLTARSVRSASSCSSIKSSTPPQPPGKAPPYLDPARVTQPSNTVQERLPPHLRHRAQPGPTPPPVPKKPAAIAPSAQQKIPHPFMLSRASNTPQPVPIRMHPPSPRSDLGHLMAMRAPPNAAAIAKATVAVSKATSMVALAVQAVDAANSAMALSGVPHVSRLNVQAAALSVSSVLAGLNATRVGLHAAAVESGVKVEVEEKKLKK